MEGYRDITWTGDEIVWTNFFRKYLYCLEHIYSLFILSDEDFTISEQNIPIFNRLNSFPTDEYAHIFSDIESKFFGERSITEYIRSISCLKHPVRRNELLTYIRLIHLYAIDTILKTYQKFRLLPQREELEINPVEMIQELIDADIFCKMDLDISQDDKHRQSTEELFSVFEEISKQVALVHRCNGIVERNESNIFFVHYDFPEKFLNQLELILYPEWYSASFMSEFSNSSAWGHYGNSHQGICLIIQSNDAKDNPFLRLRTITGWSSSSGAYYGIMSFPLYKMRYENPFLPLDFFKSIGRLPYGQLMDDWYSDKHKTISTCADWINTQEEWRKAYWERFCEASLVKTKDWEYENEYRLILSSILTDYSSLESRKLKYEFSALDGIIFGIKTPMELKQEIIKIITEKCTSENRNDFLFYQAYFCHKSKTIKSNPMPLLKFK